MTSEPLLGKRCIGTTVTFDSTAETLSVPASWPSWGRPPWTESATPDIFHVNSFVKLTYSEPTTKAGLEIQPDNLGSSSDVTIDFIDVEGNIVHSLTMTLRADGGARVAGIKSDVPIQSIAISNGTGNNMISCIISKIPA